MRIDSNLDRKQYIRSLRCNMSHWPVWGKECFTGITLGNFFYIAHHAGWEWNRRVTNEKNWAMGFASKTEGGCTVRCITMRGVTDPMSVLVMFLLCWFMGSVCYVDIPQPVTLWISVAVTALTALMSAIACLFTERGMMGREELLNLLHDPVPVWAEKHI